MIYTNFRPVGSKEEIAQDVHLDYTNQCLRYAHPLSQVGEVILSKRELPRKRRPMIESGFGAVE